MTAIIATGTMTTAPDAAAKVRRVPRIAAWGVLQTISIVVQFAGFMLLLVARGLDATSYRALGD